MFDESTPDSGVFSLYNGRTQLCQGMLSYNFLAA